MNTKISNILKISAIALAISIGVTYVYAVTGTGVTSGWTPPPSSPPNNNVEAPINTSGIAQGKTGWLTLQDLTVGGNFIIPTGKGEGKVLTSDANGKATWQTGGSGTMQMATGPYSTGSVSVNTSLQTASTGLPSTVKGIVMNLSHACPDFMLETRDMSGSVTGRYFSVTKSGDTSQVGQLAIIPLANGQFQYKGYGTSPSCGSLSWIVLGTIN